MKSSNSHPKNRSHVDRRSFLKSTLATTTALSIPGILPGGIVGKNAPSEKITAGFIGVGGHGTHRNLALFLRQPDAKAVAVCDVFKSRRENAKKIVNSKYKNSDCSSYEDFREIINRKDIDAVQISTPDHWHALMSLMAIEQGKDVICEKPTLTIEEGRLVADAVKKKKAVFQTSTEDRSYKCYHHMAEAVRNGLIGEVKEVDVRLPNGTNYPHEQPSKPPKDLNYDLWLGPAPDAPFTKNRTEKMHWRHIWDYSGGILTDWGMHQLDTVQWGLDTERTGPVEVEGSGTINEGSMYNTFIKYDVTLKYANGIKVRIRSGGTAMRFIGTKGWVGNGRFAGPLEASSEEIRKFRPGKNDVNLRTNYGGEHRDFLDAVKSRKEPYFPAEVGHRCSTLCHLGNVAMLLKRKIKWDPVKERVIDDSEANNLNVVSRKLRAPWKYPKI